MQYMYSNFYIWFATFQMILIFYPNQYKTPTPLNKITQVTGKKGWLVKLEYGVTICYCKLAVHQTSNHQTLGKLLAQYTQPHTTHQIRNLYNHGNSFTGEQ